MSYIMYLFFASHCRNYSMLCRPMQYMNRIALMHRILTTPVPQNYLCLLHHKCRLSRKSLISVLEHMSLVLVLEGQVLSCIRPYLDLHSAKTIATSIVRSKLDYCNSLYYSLPKYQIVSSTSRMLLLELLSRLQNSNTSILFRNLVTGLKFLSGLNIGLKSFLSQNYQYHLATISLLFSIMVTTHALHLVTLIKPPTSLKVTVTSILLAGVTPCDVVLGVTSFPGSACLPRECRWLTAWTCSCTASGFSRGEIDRDVMEIQRTC